MFKTTFVWLVLLFVGGAVLVDAQTLQYGNTVFGSLGSCGQVNTYSFAGSMGDQVLVELTETSDSGGGCDNSCCCLFDQSFQINDGSGSLISSAESPLAINAAGVNNCGNRFRTQDGPFMLPHNGTYTIAVKSRNGFGGGSYTLYLQRTNNPIGAAALSGQLLVPLQTAGSVQAFVFNANPNSSVNIHMLPQTGNLVPMLALYGPDGTPLALPASGTITTNLAQAGSYTLLAFSAGAETGTYELTLVASGTLLPNVHTISHIADGGGWRSTVILVNTDSVPAFYTVSLWSDTGVPYSPQLASGSLSGSIPVGGSTIIGTADTASTLTTGWAQVMSSQSIGGTTIFRYDPWSQEAAVPLLTSGSSSLEIPYQVGSGLSLGIALANPSATQTASITETIRDQNGKQLSSRTLTLPALNHAAFNPTFPSGTTGGGVVEYDASVNIFALGIRSAPEGVGSAFTSVGAAYK